MGKAKEIRNGRPCAMEILLFKRSGHPELVEGSLTIFAKGRRPGK
jgi:hypothetical protein